MARLMLSERIGQTYTHPTLGGLRSSWTADVDQRGVMVMFEPEVWYRAGLRGESAAQVIDGLCEALKRALLQVAAAAESPESGPKMAHSHGATTLPSSNRPRTAVEPSEAEELAHKIRLYNALLGRDPETGEDIPEP